MLGLILRRINIKDEIKDDVLRFVINRAPNGVRGEIIIRRLGNKYDQKEIGDALAKLVSESKPKESLIPEGWKTDTGAMYRGYALPSYENIPIRKTITVGDTLVPRILRTGLISLSLEDTNEQEETLSEHSASIEKRFSEIFKEEIRKYWGNLITMFVIFVAIFSFIIVTLPRMNFPAPYHFWQILWAGAAQVSPVAIILAGFAFLLWKLFR